MLVNHIIEPVIKPVIVEPKIPAILYESPNLKLYARKGHYKNAWTLGPSNGDDWAYA